MDYHAKCVKIFLKICREDNVMNLNHSKGFTLMEVLIVVAIMGIIASLAAPSMIKLIQQYQVNTEARALVASMQENRSKAILERQVRLEGKWKSNHVNVQLYGYESGEEVIFFHGFLGNLIEYSPLQAPDDCIRLIHSQNSEIETSIAVSRQGSTRVFKNRKECR